MLHRNISFFFLHRNDKSVAPAAPRLEPKGSSVLLSVFYFFLLESQKGTFAYRKEKTHDAASFSIANSQGRELVDSVPLQHSLDRRTFSLDIDI